jgi:hypothetical protein
MTAVAAEVADGMLVHAFPTGRYLREVTLPQVESELARHGKPRDGFDFAWTGPAAVEPAPGRIGASPTSDAGAAPAVGRSPVAEGRRSAAATRQIIVTTR